jgi:hypothetical protein
VPEDNLLDAFVNIRVDEAILKAAENTVDEAVKRIKEKFLGMNTAAGQAANQASIILQRATTAASGGGGKRPSEEVARDFLEAKRVAEDLTEQARILRSVVNDTGSDDLANRLTFAANELKRVFQEIRRDSQDASLFSNEESVANIQKSTVALQNLANEFENIQSASSRAALLRFDATNIQSEFQERLGSFRRQDKLDASLTRGSVLDGNQKRQLAEIKKEIEDIVAEFQALANAEELSIQKVTRLRELYQQLDTAAEATQEIRRQAQAAGGSFNSLSNNAYQLGQAFEDASVGYQLNGIAGAVRGAANNVAFLLNNLSQVPQVQDVIGKKASDVLPFFAGVGAAIAITVLAPMAEWLVSLFDVETQLDDIQRKIKRTFDGIDLRISLAEDQTDFQKLINDAKDFATQISAIAGEAFTAEGKKRNFLAQLVGLTSGEQGNEVLNQIDVVARQGARELFRRLEAAADSVNPSFLKLDLLKESAGFSPFGGEEFVPLLKNVQQLEKSFKEIRESAKNGIATDEITKFAEASRIIVDDFEKLKEEFNFGGTLFGKIGEADFEKIKETFTEVERIASSANEEFLRFRSLTTDVLNTIISKSGQIAEKQRLIRESLTGQRPESDVFLLELEQQNEEYRKQIALIEQTAKAQGQDINLINQAVSIQEGLRRGDLENKILERKKDIQEQINDLKDEENEKDKRSIQLQFESLAQRLQTNVLSTDRERERRQKELSEREFELDKLNRAQQRNLSGAGFRDIVNEMQPSRLQVIDGVGAAGIISAYERFMSMSIEEQKRTTEAVKGIDATTRAQ